MMGNFPGENSVPGVGGGGEFRPVLAPPPPPPPQVMVICSVELQYMLPESFTIYLQYCIYVNN